MPLLLLLAPKLGKFRQYLHRRLHLLEAGELQRRVEVVHARGEVGRGEPHLGQPGSVGPAAQGKELGLHTVGEAMTIINEAVGNDANVIMGTVIDKDLADALRITVIATGFGYESGLQPAPRKETLHPRAKSGATVPLATGPETPEPIPVGEPVMSQDMIRERWERSHGQDRDAVFIECGKDLSYGASVHLDPLTISQRTGSPVVIAPC